MNSNQRNNLEYRRRIDKALEFVRANLDKSIVLKDVARAACFSPYHFHRIFRGLMGETLGEYITRKRLERAAIKLAYSSETTVTTIAYEYGYASVSSFSKAFNQRFGCRPTEITDVRRFMKTGVESHDRHYSNLTNINLLFVGPSAQSRTMRFKEIDSRVRIGSIKEFDVVYITSPKGYDASAIMSTWNKLMELADDRNIRNDHIKRFSLSHDHPGLTSASLCRYDACLQLPDNDMSRIKLPKTTIPSGQYAIFPVKGPGNSILNQYLEFYTVWMPSSGYEPDDFPVLEHYLPDCTEDCLCVELWAKIRPLPYFIPPL